MIRLNVSEQQLFYALMAVNSMGNVEDGHRQPAAYVGAPGDTDPGSAYAVTGGGL